MLSYAKFIPYKKFIIVDFPVPVKPINKIVLFLKSFYYYKSL